MGQVSWRLGVSIRAYRELEAGTRFPSSETWHRICEPIRLAADVRQPTLTKSFEPSAESSPSPPGRRPPGTVHLVIA